ncbi:MAG: PA14 domain-containing protein [Planctomycetota bacterium]
MNKKMRLFMLTCVCVTMLFNVAFADKAGLIGIQYGSEDFDDAEQLVVLSSLDNTWSEDDSFGRQWSGRWEGFLVGPVDGEVELTVETDQKATIASSGKVLIPPARITMVKGKRYPVVISYVKTGDEHDCYLRIKWSWADQEPTVIGGSSLVYADDVEAKFSKIVAASGDGDDDDEEQVILPPTWNENSIPGSDELPLQYMGPGLPDGEAADGRLMYSPGVQNIQINRANRKYPPPFPEGTENERGWTYQHHVGIGCWKGRLYGIWDMTHVGEDNPPARLVYATSSDGFNWTEPKDLYPFNKVYNLRFYFFHSSNDRMLVFAAGWYETDNIGERHKDRLYVREITTDHKLGTIYTLIKPAPGHPPFYTESKDAGFLQACREALANKPLLEQGDYGLLLGERKMKWHDGKNWPGGKIARFSDLWQFGKSLCFYYRADGVLVATCKMGWVNLSRDGGETWSFPTIPKGIKGGGGKLWAQRTPDGRCAMIYIPQSDHRYPMAITSSDDGITFKDMRVIHGDVAPQRYKGRAKDIGPQYLRGISEWGSDGSRPEKDCIWTICSMNKEDIWASRIPVPIIAEAKAHANDNFDDVAAGPRVPGWNTYSSLWAPVRIAADRGLSNHYLELEDREPTDYARAIRTFPQSKAVTASFRVAAGQTDRGRLEVELLGELGTRPVRIIVNDHVTSAGAWLDYKIHADCAAGKYTVVVNGREVLKDAAFTEPSSVVYALSFRTGEFRGKPRGRARRDIPNSEEPLATVTYRIDDVMTENVQQAQ